MVALGQESPDEGGVTRKTEDMTAEVPSMAYLTGAVGSMIVSAALHVSGRKNLSLFVGQWAPSFLLLGIYNKIVKVSGSD